MPGQDHDNEKIHDTKSILNSILYLIESRIPLQMEFPRSHFMWITFLLEMKKTGQASFLLIDHVKQFEDALATRPDGEISLEFREKSGVPCIFHTKVLKCTPEGIWAEFPDVIHRVQKRQNFRIEPPLGSEIIFQQEMGVRGSATLQNLSAGGAAFFVKKGFNLSPGDVLHGVELKISAGDEGLVFVIPEATVRRIGKEYDYRKSLIGIEFTNISDQTRNDILAYILRAQREWIRKIGR